MACTFTWTLGGCCCNVTFDVVCGDEAVPGSTVTVSSDGTAVASGTTDDSGQVSLEIPEAGSYDVTATGGDTGYDGEMGLSCGGYYTLQTCGCGVTICVKACPGGGDLEGASVTITPDGGDPVSGTTPSSGCIELDIGSSGSCQVEITADGYQPYDGTLELDCDNTYGFTLVPDTVDASVLFTVTGCCSAPLPGATVTLSDGQSGVTNSSGQVSFFEGIAGAYDYTIAKSRWETYSGSFTIESCQNFTTPVPVTMTPASGYVCGLMASDGSPIADPIPTTLPLTDSVYGGTSITYDADSTAWIGTISASYPGSEACNCPAAAFTITYSLPACPSTDGLKVTWDALTYTFCEFGEGITVQSYCPADPGEAVTCAGKAPGNYLTNPAHSDVLGPAVAGTTSTTVPYDYSGTIAACDCEPNPNGDYSCGGTTGAYGGIPWPSGATITITE